MDVKRLMVAMNGDKILITVMVNGARTNEYEYLASDVVNADDVETFLSAAKQDHPELEKPTVDKCIALLTRKRPLIEARLARMD